VLYLRVVLFFYVYNELQGWFTLGYFSLIIVAVAYSRAGYIIIASHIFYTHVQRSPTIIGPAYQLAERPSPRAIIIRSSSYDSRCPSTPFIVIPFFGSLHDFPTTTPVCEYFFDKHDAKCTARARNVCLVVLYTP